MNWFKLAEEVKVPDRFNQTVFHKIQCRSYENYLYSGFKEWEEFKQITTSGRTVNIPERTYECKANDKIVWINEKDLRFPK